MSLAAAAAAYAAAQAAARDAEEAKTQIESSKADYSMMMRDGLAENSEVSRGEPTEDGVMDGMTQPQMNYDLSAFNNLSDTTALIQQMASEQQFQQQGLQQQIAAAAMAAAAAEALKARPEEHFLTMSQNGMFVSMLYFEFRSKNKYLCKE